MHVSNQWFKINQNHLTFYWQIWNSQERAIKTSQCFTIQQTSGLIVMALAQTEKMIPFLVIAVLLVDKTNNLALVSADSLIATRPAYLRSPVHSRVSAQIGHPRRWSSFDTVFARIPGEVDEEWKTELQKQKQQSQTYRRRNPNIPREPYLLSVTRMPSMDYLVTWTLSRGQTISRSKHSDQSNDAATSASQSENDLMTSNQFTIEGIDFGLSFDSISYFSVHLIELSSFTDVTSYVGAKFVFEVLPSTSPGLNHFDNTATIKEAILILLSLCGWAILVYMFFRQWGAIKNLQPRETRYTPPPKPPPPEDQNSQLEANPPEPDLTIVSVGVNDNVTNGTSTPSPTPVFARKESRVNKIAKFRRMRDYRIGLLKHSSLKSLSSRGNSRNNLSSVDIRSSTKQSDL
ncbi:uncharacterized protein LOC134839880 isoform X2 [Symsagittifera roscoffensis]|uniref:uncharacterized protein LOC134839880 isoform X2 n=1 Tax=Symsagittifera roscoffensis TaxID=84072 RepID=UPI00307C5DA6